MEHGGAIAFGRGAVQEVDAGGVEHRRDRRREFRVTRRWSGSTTSAKQIRPAAEHVNLLMECDLDPWGPWTGGPPRIS
jgi:hypothetical protein|nr:hypothetical protein JVH1_3392 [Rhodococcus sp. JVH1]